MTFIDVAGWQIYDSDGRRKYVSAREWSDFLSAADALSASPRALCYLLAYTGCRISEALGLHRGQIDREAGIIVLKTLKRRKVIHRAVPLPGAVISMLLDAPATPDGRLWPMHRATAWKHVKAVMDDAGIRGPMACCRGLRHGFGIRAAEHNVPQNLIRRWMGHARPQTTEIYVDAVGVEEREFAARMWPSGVGHSASRRKGADGHYSRAGRSGRPKRLTILLDGDDSALLEVARQLAELCALQHKLPRPEIQRDHPLAGILVGDEAGVAHPPADE